MLIKFNLDKESVIKLYYNSMVETKRFNKKKVWIDIYILCLLALIFVLVNDKDVRIYSLMIGIIIGCIFKKQLSKILYKYIFSKDFNKEEYSYMFKEITICIKEENINIITFIGERNIKFSSISSLDIIENHLFITLCNKEHILIPLSTFQFSNEKEDFIKLLEKKAELKVTNSYPENLFCK